MPNTCMLGTNLLLYFSRLLTDFSKIPVYGSERTQVKFRFGIRCTEMLVRSLGNLRTNISILQDGTRTYLKLLLF